MAHDSHGAVDAHHPAGEHPELPPVTDEAADSPMWLPVSGLVLLVLAVIFALWRSASAPDEVPADVAADEAPAAEVVPAEAE